MSLLQKTDDLDEHIFLLNATKENQVTPPKMSYLRMVFLVIIVVSPSIFCGVNISYPSIALTQMHLSADDASWFGSISSFVNPLGSLLIGVIIDKFGRKFALIFSVVPGLLGWLLIYGEYDTFRTLTGRILTGITAGAVFYPGQVYVGECIVVDDHHLRSRFAMWFGIANSVGMFLVLTLSYFMNYNDIAIVMIVIAIAIIMLFHIFISESPLWLLHMGRIEEAKRCEKKLGIYHPVLSNYEESEGIFTMREDEGDYVKHFKNVYAKLRRKDVYKPLLIMTAVLCLVMLSGGIVVMTYLFDILRYTTDFSDSSYQTPEEQLESSKFGVYSGILIIVANLLTCFLVPYVGVKKITINSCLFMMVGLLMLYFSYTQSELVSTSTMHTIHIIAIWVVVFAFNSGLLNVPVCILGDVFPTDAKGLASIPVFAFCFTCAILIKFFPGWYIEIGANVYLIYTGLTACAGIVIALYMPETVGKSLKNINDEFFA